MASLKEIYEKSGLVMHPAAMKDGKLYSQAPHSGDGDFTFSRADGVQTRINKHGLIETVADNTPRLSYDVVGGEVAECPHLLLEPSRTNLLTYSEDFTQWDTNGVPTVTAVNNTLTGQANAYNVEDDNPSGYERVEFNVATTADDHTLSVFIKKKEASVSAYGGVQMGSSNKYIIFDSYNGTFNTVTGSDYTEVSVDDYGSYWRLKATVTTSAGSTRVGLWGAISVNGTSISTSATGSETFYGVQVEVGSYATSYIPTSGSAETRETETANGSGNSTVFNDSEGVLYAEIAALANNGGNRRLGISDGDLTDRVIIGFTSSDNQVQAVVSNDGTQADIAHTTSDVLSYNKIAFKYKENDFALWINGTEVGTDTGGTTPIGLNQALFDDGGGSQDFYGKVKQLVVFNEALTDTELETLTS